MTTAETPNLESSRSPRRSGLEWKRGRSRRLTRLLDEACPRRAKLKVPLKTPSPIWEKYIRWTAPQVTDFFDLQSNNPFGRKACGEHRIAECSSPVNITRTPQCAGANRGEPCSLGVHREICCALWFLACPHRPDGSAWERFRRCHDAHCTCAFILEPYRVRQTSCPTRRGGHCVSRRRLGSRIFSHCRSE
jgi:hypothetical protein